MLPIAVQDILYLQQTYYSQSSTVIIHIQISRVNLGCPIRSFRCIRSRPPTI